MPEIDHQKHIIEIARIVKNILTNTKLSNSFLDQTNTNGEHSIVMDVTIENSIIDYLKSQKLPYKMFGEEGGDIDINENPQFYITVDPLDGSTNYSVGKNLLPYGLLVSIYKNLNPKLSEIICSLAYEFTNDLTWIYIDGKTYQLPDYNQVNLNNSIDVTMHTPVYLDLYKKVSYDFYSKIAEKVFIRNTGSTIGNLALVLSGAAEMIGGSVIKSEEIGAIYSLIKGANGKIINEKGEDIGDLTFQGGTTYDIIGGNPIVVNFVLDQIN